MNAFWGFFLKKKIFSHLVMVALVIFGVYALLALPKESNPEVTVPIGVVTTTLFGASALDTETLITNKIEEQLKNNLDDVKKITSTSREGGSSVVVEFNADADIDKSIQKLKDEVDKVKPDLPEEATDPSVIQVDFNNQPILTFDVSSDLPEGVFVSIAKRLEEDLKTVPGVSDVSVSGLRNREVQVIVSKEALNSFGLNITDVIGAIAATNNTLPAGSIVVDNVKYNVEFEGDINDPQEIADIAILSEGGEPIYVRDIATVIDGFDEPRTLSRFSLDGAPSQPSLSFNIFKRSGGDITEITSAVRKRIEELQQPGELLDGLGVLIVFDTGEFLIRDLRDLSRTGLQTVALVMLVLFVAVGWRESLVAGSAVPLSFLIAFIGLLASGNTLNFVSLFSLILAVGILVDSGIVIVEGINLRLSRYKDHEDAAKAAVREFHAPLTSGTMTTIAVFAPLFFISGIAGEFIKSIPFTVIFILLASLLVALGFVPLIASEFMKERKGESRLGAKQAYYTEKIKEWYRSKLLFILETRRHENIFLGVVSGLIFFSISLPIKGILMGIFVGTIMGYVTYLLFKNKHRWYTRLPIFIATMALSLFLGFFMPKIGAVPVTFFDAGDEDFLIVEMELPEGTVLGSTDIESRKIEEILYTEPEIESFTVTVGAGSPYLEGGTNTKLANAFLLLRKDRKHTSEEIMNELRERFSVIDTSIVRVNQISSGPPVGTPVVITFLGNDLDQLERLAQTSADILREIPGTSNVTTSTKDDGTQFILTIDKARATELGLNSNIVSQTLRASISGINATTIKSIEDDIDVRVVLDLNPDYLTPHDTNRANIDAIRQIEVQTPNGPVLLGSLLQTHIAKSKPAIAHEDGKRSSTAGSELAEGGNTREIVSEFRSIAKERNIVPEGVEMIIGGENEESDQSFAEMGVAFIVGVVLMFAILVLEFNSLRYAVYILSVIPTSFVGLFIGLLLTGKSLSFPSLMGLIALSGIVVNNAIILISVINSIRTEEPNSDLRSVIVRGAVSRLRPILLTTLTTIVGIAPLTLASELWAPLAWAVMFGLAFTATATLILVPLLYHRKPGIIR